MIMRKRRAERVPAVTVPNDYVPPNAALPVVSEKGAKMPGKWLDPEPHRCDLPEVSDHNVGRRWQCDCGQIWKQVAYGLPGMQALFWEKTC